MSFRVQNKERDSLRTQEGNGWNLHTIMTWIKCHLPSKTLCFPNLGDWGKGRRVNTLPKWEGHSFILTREQKSSKLLPTTMLSFLSIAQKLQSTTHCRHSFSEQVWQTWRHLLCLANAPWFLSHCKSDWIFHPFKSLLPVLLAFLPPGHIPRWTSSIRLHSCCSGQLPALQLKDYLREEGTNGKQNFRRA